MAKTKPNSQGPKTLEQHKRTLERKDDMPRRDGDGNIAADPSRNAPNLDRSARQSERPVSRRGMNQESRHHKG